MFNSKAIVALSLTALGSFQSAYGQEAFQFVVDTTNSVSATLTTIAALVITIAIIIAGLGMALFEFQGRTVMKILAGGALVGGATQIAAVLVG